jgi:toxin secretion/phage lysis holin
MITLKYMYVEAAHNKLIQLVIIAIITDTVFGMLRAIKDHDFNSCFGINGAIRKCAMILSIILLVIVDYITQFNLIGFLPEEVRRFFGESIGISEFFEILFLTYEVVSILKNMVLCGLPVKKVWLYVKMFLSKYTDELPDDDELADTTSKTELGNEKYIS